MLCLLVLNSPARAGDDITFQQGRQFFLIASAHCLRVAQADIELALDCDFRGKKAQFYLKEVPDLWPETSRGETWRRWIIDALRQVVEPLAPADLIERISEPTGGGGSITWGGGRAILNRAAFLYKTTEDMQHDTPARDKRVLLRLDWIVGRGTAVLIAFSDFDLEVVNQVKAVRVPEEVRTILVSLGPVAERSKLP
jgi:hypothetical protein